MDKSPSKVNLEVEDRNEQTVDQVNGIVTKLIRAKFIGIANVEF